MKLISKLFVLIVPVLFTSCTENDVTSRDYPRLNTLEVTNISQNGATFNAQITYGGNCEVLSFGYVWSKSDNPTLESSEKIIYTENIKSGTFSATILTTLEKGVSYFVRPFLITQDYLVFGKVVEFFSLGSNAPIISDFYPSTGSLGDTITIIGTGFSFRSTSNIVKFSNAISLVVFSTDSLLRVTVPENLANTSASISIEIASKTTITSTPFILKIPTLLASNKATINMCDTVVFNVANIGPVSTPRIFFNNKVSEILSKTQNLIKVLVPVLPANNLSVQAKLLVGSFESTLPGLMNLNPPDFAKLEPAGSSFLDTLTLNVRNMPHCEFNVKIDGKAVPILESFNEYFKVIVPGVLDDPWRIRLQIYLKGETLYDTLYYRILRIDSVTPSSGKPGDIITIKGRGFHPTLNNNVVCFTCQTNGHGDHGQIISGNTHELKVKIPNTPPNKIGISIFTQNLGSSNFPFEVRY
jgi:hypothetical protein